MKGFTLIETVVVTAILLIISLTAVETIVEFQKQSILENTSRELVSTLRQAQNKSTAGELISGTTTSDYSLTGLPAYGVNIGASSYSLYRSYTTSGNVAKKDTIQTTTTDPSLSSTTADVLFVRITGVSGAATVSIKRATGHGKQIQIDTNGVIKVINI